MIVESKKRNSDAGIQSNIWSDILKESMLKKDLEESNIFIFGDKFTGKRSLIRIINKELLQKGELEEHKKMLGYDETVAKYGLLDYTYLNIKKISEQDADSIGKMNIWISNDMVSKEIFETIIKPDFLLKSMCMICVDLSRPWEIMANLKKWSNFIYETFSSLLLKFPYEKQQELRDNITEYIKLFEEPQFDEEGNFKKEPTSPENINLKLQLPMKEGVLKTNIGVPLVILVNKSDIVSQTGERKRFEEDSEFILKHIRNFALTYGATIIYVSTKQNINLNVLYEYILHRIYKFEFRHKANTMDKDSYFIPAGYDSTSVLKNFDIQNELGLLFEDRVPVVKPKNVINEEEITCEDVNVFLKRFVDKGHKIQSANQSRRNVSSDYGTEDNRQILISEEARANTRDTKDVNDLKDNFSSNKVNFDIFKQSTKLATSIDVTSYNKNASTADKLEAIKKSHEKLLATDKSVDKTEKTEKYEKTRENFMKKLNQLRKDPKDTKDTKDTKDLKTQDSKEHK